uniref:copine-3 n=1 Tax=Ciona intestinalis TaxID=7719 RepID=UPI000180B707|nr:copine-3 [Ciona intestinalis]|eukprot:XP_026695754.1 copine-3 [Ciona intestinalis]
MSGMVTKVEIRVSCAGLVSRDALSASDPVVVLRMREPNGKYHEIGRTEKVKNNNSPVFANSIELDYRFEEVQHLKFKVVDIDNDSATLDDDDGLGSVELTLAQIVSAKELTKKLRRKSSETEATITIKATEITNINEVEFNLRGEGLDKKDFLGKSDPFLEIYREDGEDQWTLVHKTEVVKGTLNPVWNKFSIRVQTLCNGNMDASIKFRCFDFDKNGEHDLIGEFCCSLNDVIDVKPQPCLALVNHKKKAKKKDYKKSGRVTFARCKVVKKYSFLDYVFGGCHINFTCGIDFTGSNGDPRRKDSLHYLEGIHPNEYAQAILSIGRVIQDYDTDQLYPAFGFGAKIPPNNEVSHEFPLNFQPQNPYCQGVEGLMAAYHNAIRNVRLWGPTNVAPIINHVARFAFETQLNPKATQYFVLLLITDGEITDMEQTSHAIVRASNLPLSIIIIGVGNADFTAMEFLDGDQGVLASLVDGTKAARDIVQFVPFRKFKLSSAGALSSTVLGEIPRQVTEYFSIRNMPPGVEGNNEPVQPSSDTREAVEPSS